MLSARTFHNFFFFSNIYPVSLYYYTYVCMLTLGRWFGEYFAWLIRTNFFHFFFLFVFLYFILLFNVDIFKIFLPKQQHSICGTPSGPLTTWTRPFGYGRANQTDFERNTRPGARPAAVAPPFRSVRDYKLPVAVANSVGSATTNTTIPTIARVSAAHLTASRPSSNLLKFVNTFFFSTFRKKSERFRNKYQRQYIHTYIGTYIWTMFIEHIIKSLLFVVLVCRPLARTLDNNVEFLAKKLRCFQRSEISR